MYGLIEKDRFIRPKRCPGCGNLYPLYGRQVHCPDCRKHFLKHEPTQRMKREAAIAVRRAFRRGEITRKPCERCGDEPAQGHHEDYSKPLDLVWLCTLCHSFRHDELKQQVVPPIETFLARKPKGDA